MFNLFHKTDEPTIVCALRDGSALPGFLRSPAWEFEGRASRLDSTTAALDARAEAAMFRQAGFYIFTRH